MNKQFVQLKGTKGGLMLHLDDQCSYADLIQGVEEGLNEAGIDGKIDVQLHLGLRYCTTEQKKELIQRIQAKGNVLVSKVLSDVLTVEESNKRMEQQSVDTYVGIVRSGQLLRSKGDLIVIGDVNPNGKLEAVGNVYVLGKLKGIVHAGVEGDEEAIISASTFEPTHVAIAHQLAVMSNEQEIVQNQHKQQEHLFAYLNHANEITYSRIQEVRNVRPSLSMFKGGS
jgi:septum site-determining protein MinC